MRQKLGKKPGFPHLQLIEEMITESALIGAKHRELEAFAKLRNAIVHTRYPDAEPIAEPHERIVEDYEQAVRELIHPPSVMKMAIPVKDIFTTDLDQSVVAVITTMNSKAYTHAPILDGGMLVGVFSETSIFSYLAEHRAATITSKTVVGEFRAFLPLSKHTSETFDFLAGDSTVADIASRFRHSFDGHTRLSAVFITDSGTEAGQLLGLVTAWDIAATHSGVMHQSRRL
jgi:CBS domain-containing protein